MGMHKQKEKKMYVFKHLIFSKHYSSPWTIAYSLHHKTINLFHLKLPFFLIIL